MHKVHAIERVKELEELAKVKPTAAMLADLAACYFTLERTEEALPLAKIAWDRNKNSAIGMNLALILKDLGRHQESLAVVEQAFHSNPDDFYIRMGYGEGLLKAGFWEQGWPIYDNARPTQQGAAFDLRLPGEVKEWVLGQTLPEGHLLLVINEGGTGDRISYARWLHELTKRGINWIFFPYEELFPFFERIFPREKLIKDGDRITATHWTTTFALPAKLNISPSQVPPPLSFQALPENIAKYKLERSDDKPIVGLCYSAAEKFQGDRKVRSLTEGQAMRLVCMTGDKVHWVNLQYDQKLPFPVTNLPFRTWEDTAGLIHNLDGVVTVDTGVMHLTGALNKSMAVLLPGNSCWKFLKTGRKLKLYPSATFYRNRGLGFENSIDDLVKDIRAGLFSK